MDLPDGRRFWGRAGAAGLLVVDPSGAVLLQHRVGWSHFGGTWGLPGGARKEGETAEAGALREAQEEAGVPASLVSVLFTSGHAVVRGVTAALTQRGQLVIVRRKQCATADRFIQILGHRPSNREPVEGTGATADLVQDDQGATGRVL